MRRLRPGPMDMKTKKRGNNMAKTLALTMTFLCLLFTQPMAGIAQQTDSAASNAVPPSSNAAPPLRIGPGDLVEVTMFENPDLSGHYRVDQDGDIAVALIGHLHVAGMTANEAAAAIEKRFVDEQILLPAGAHATVFIAEYATQGITINGEVKTPGVYPALGIRKLNDVVVAAGGVTPAASSKVIVVRKDDPGNSITVDYNPEALKPVITDIQIFPGDSIFVPRAGIVYVVGNVQKTGGFVLDGRQQLTVEEALALAGGNKNSPDLKRVQLVRTLDDGRKEAVTIPVNQIIKGRAPDVAMKDGDILYVPTSNVRLVTLQAITDMVGIGSGLVLFRATNQ
jgi:polysaccharide biosynthesis/export protein